MAATEQTLIVPFKGGLDTWSNPQLLPPGTLTASTGIMLDRKGFAYPGPGYSSTQWAPTGTYNNHGIGALSHGPATDSDQLAFWSTISGGSGPGITKAPVYNVEGTIIAPTSQPLAPWRQVTQNFVADAQNYINATYGIMSGPPQMAVANGRAFYVWLTTGGRVVMVYQDLSTRAWTGPYYLNNFGSDASWVTTGSPCTTAGKVVVASDGTFLRLAVLSSATGRVSFITWIAIAPLVAPAGNVTSPASTTITQIDGCGSGDEGLQGYGTFAVLDSTTNQVTAFPFSYADGGYTAGTPVLSLAVAPITCSMLRGNTTSTGFIFGSFVTTAPNAHPAIRTTDFSINTLSSGDITAFGAGSGLKTMTVANIVAGSSTAIALATEYSASSVVSGTTYVWNAIRVQTMTLNGGTVSAFNSNTDLYSWGGLALLGKFVSWYNGTDFRALFAVRSGWRHDPGTWGTITTAGATYAYPNGYLYDSAGTLWGKFGDGDVGTDSLWPEFADAGYTAVGIQPVASGYRYNLASGQQTFGFSWPQLGHVDFVSTRTADSGSPIGNRAGLSTVTWLAPTAAEPPAPMVQFGNSLVIPGTITAYFDGNNISEAGYFHRCPTPVVASKGSGGVLPTGTIYYVQAVAVYSDASGRFHFSAPSLRVAVTTGAANDAINFTMPAINQTLRTSTTNPIAYRLYRSAGGATGNDIPMYHVATLKPVNAPNTLFLSTVFDGTADSNLAQCEQLYTINMDAGASIGTYAPPPFDSIRVWNDQVWGVSNRNGPELWCTWKQDTAVLEPEGAAWSVANRLALPAEIGQPRALCDFDEKLIVLGSKTDYGIIAEQTLDRASSIADNPATFSSPVALPTPGGCQVLNGVTRLPGGILFQGTAGFLMLQRDLTYAPVGEPVNDFSNTNLYLPGVVLPSQPAVLLFCASDVTKNLLYFYQTGEWAQPEQPPIGDGTTSAATGVISAARAVAGGSSQMYAIASTQPYYFQIQRYSKYVSFRTPWIQLEDKSPYKGSQTLAGYGILREAHVLGILPNAAFGTSQTLTLYTEYDFAGNTNQLPETQALSLTSGTQADLEYQWRFGFERGMAKRVRFTVAVDGGQRTNQGATSPTVLLSGLMLSYSVDAGLSRLGSANSAGT